MDYPQSGGNTAILKHAARIKVDFGFPVFSRIHLKDFEGRLSLQTGEVTYSANTGYSSVKINTRLAHGSNVWVIVCENIPNTAFIQGHPARVSLERMGSRAFASRHGGRFPKDVTIGIGDTRASVKGKDILLEEKGDGPGFVIACRVTESLSPTVINSHTE